MPLSANDAAGHPAVRLFQDRSAETDLHLARGRAIEIYARIEIALAMLFSHLMRVTADFAGVSFFRINNARARIAILERLMKKRYGGQYNLFWNSLAKQLQEIDGARNNIVHWAQICEVRQLDGGESQDTYYLSPPNYWDYDAGTPRVDLSDIYDFVLKCAFFSSLVLRFVGGLNFPEQAVKPPWPEIFQQPITYPPPETHPLYRMP